MNGDKINAVFSMNFHSPEPIIQGELLSGLAGPGQGVVYGNRPDHYRNFRHQPFPEALSITGNTEVHDCISLEFQGKLGLVHLAVK